MAELKLNLTFVKATKGTRIYAEQFDDPKQRGHSFYILNATAAKLNNPEKLTATLTTG